MNKEIKAQILEAVNKSKNPVEYINELRQFLSEVSPIQQPIDFVRWVDIDMVCPNDYNPNSVAKVEMGLLYKSIEKDGYTQPIVTIYDPALNKYVIVDGFHRYHTAKSNPDILARNKGTVPIVVIKKNINERMSATVRHNRARGQHSIAGMSNMVFQMLDNGWTDAEICNELGMSADEIIRLKHITGFSKLYESHEYRKAWETKKQFKERVDWEKENSEKTIYAKP